MAWTPSYPEKTTRGEALRACLFALILLWINSYVVRDLFSMEPHHMGSMHGFWTALAARAGDSWFRANWWPFWELGIPFEYTYPPLVPGLAALIAALRGTSPGVGYESVTALCYIFGPLTLFLAAWRLTRAPGVSFAASLAYSLTSITQMLMPDAKFSLGNFWEARRLFVTIVWDDTPHVAALTLLPLVILFLARSLETRKPGYYAATAACIGGCALASAFGPVMVVLAAICLLLVVRTESWFRNLLLTIGLGMWGWAIAAPFLSPSLMSAIHEANAVAEDQGWSLGSITAIAFTITGLAAIWQYVPRWTSDWRVRFFALLAWLMTSIPLAQALLHDHFLPQPNRYKFEMELALWLFLVFALAPVFKRIGMPVRLALVFFLLALGAEQVRDFRRSEKKFTFPQPVTETVEYRAAMWAQQTYPTIRAFMPGSIAQWTNTYTDVQQFTGESFTMAVNQVQQRAGTAIGFGMDDVEKEKRISLAWMKAFGVGIFGISSKDSQEYWKGFTHPDKFVGLLPVLWSSGGVTMYRIPLREFTLAHVVPESALVRHVPREPDDTTEVERFAAALDDPSLPGTAFAWEGRNRIRIRTTAAPGRVVVIQESYHPGWHATIGGRTQKVNRDGLGLMWLKPDRVGDLEIVLDYDGGWELRLCRWLSWLAMAALVAVPVVSVRRARGRVAPLHSHNRQAGSGLDD